jgi:hypothetical protein
MASLRLRLHTSDSPPQIITVCTLDPVQTLDNWIPRGGRQFIVYKGSVLMSAFSFQYHGIKDGDDIYIVQVKGRTRAPPGPQDTKSALQKLFTREQQTDRFVLNERSLMMELARLCDLSGHWGPWGSRASQTAEEQRSKSWTTLLADLPRPLRPNTDALPRCWK